MIRFVDLCGITAHPALPILDPWIVPGLYLTEDGVFSHGTQYWEKIGEDDIVRDEFLDIHKTGKFKEPILSLPCTVQEAIDLLKVFGQEESLFNFIVEKERWDLVDEIISIQRLASDINQSPTHLKTLRTLAILNCLEKNKINPLALHVGSGQISGSKSVVRNALQHTALFDDKESTFDSFWKDLKKEGVLADQKS